MRCINWKTVSTLVAMGLVGGCSETIVQPASSAFEAPETLSMARAPQGRPSFNVVASTNSTGSSVFSVGPSGGYYTTANAAVYFPANSICDPATANYTGHQWDAPCATISAPIQITAVTRVQNGRTQVDFSPELRFAPSSNPTRWVWLYMSVPSLAGTTDLEAFKIFYAPTFGAPLVDESLTDPTLRTYVDTRTGTSLRRVKHFSGYVVTSGRCDPTTQTCPDTTTSPTP